MSQKADSLVQAHARLAALLGDDIEPVEVFERAEEHRAYWRPDDTRVVLLAESHVYTRPEELRHSLRAQLDLPARLPRGFVRLVYALGYGENELLDLPISHPRNSGTPQYWKIFQSCLRSIDSGADFGTVQVLRTPSSVLRLRNKLLVLDELRRRGIWLVDASIAALYLPGEAKPSPRLREAVLRASWDAYARSAVERAEPAAILCIGVGVARALRSRLDSLAIPWGAVHQPQAHLSSEEHSRIHAAYFAVCADPRQIGLVPSII
jgi:hypothetical protein